MKKESVVGLTWWAVSWFLTISCVVWAMIWGWGLWPKSWFHVVLAYVVLQAVWPVTIMCRVKFLKYLWRIDLACRCQDCGHEYKVDLTVPDYVWEEIKPAGKPRGSGLLCGACIMKRIELISDYDAWRLVREIKQ